MLDQLATTHPHLIASREPLAEMQPSQYVILSLAEGNEISWNYLAANYAAALFAPLYLIKGTIIGKTENLRNSLRFLSGPASGLRTVDDSVRSLIGSVVEGIPDELKILPGSVPMDLASMQPTYISFISSLATFPIELVGDPPLATRFAVGRLAGPDLLSTSLLVTRAALSEDLIRPVDIFALLAESHDAVPEKLLPGACIEAESLNKVLLQQP